MCIDINLNYAIYLYVCFILYLILTMYIDQIVYLVLHRHIDYRDNWSTFIELELNHPPGPPLLFIVA